VGGRSLEALSRGATPDLFNRLVACARLARDTAKGDYGIAALLMLQGENNAWALNGCTADRAEYRAKLRQFLADFDTEVVRGVAGQSALPALFIYQVGGAYSTDDMGVAMAQLDMALTDQRVFMPGPVYPVTDKGGHLDANGYRWLGAQFGRVMHRVITLGEDWQPLHPIAARHDGDEIWVEFHVPVPPLAWSPCYVGHTARVWDDFGFTLRDAKGRVMIQEVVLGATHVRLRPERPLGDGAELLYADRAHHGGHGNLHDSETAVAQDRYVFGPGHPPEANVPELVGQPYRLQNWCVAFRIEIADQTSS
jgi:hypothetical protein